MRPLRTIIADAAVALGLMAGTARAESTIDQIRARGILQIADIINEVPYFNKDPRTGKWRQPFLPG